MLGNPEVSGVAECRTASQNKFAGTWMTSTFPGSSRVAAVQQSMQEEQARPGRQRAPQAVQVEDMGAGQALVAPGGGHVLAADDADACNTQATKYVLVMLPPTRHPTLNECKAVPWQSASVDAGSSITASMVSCETLESNVFDSYMNGAQSKHDKVPAEETSPSARARSASVASAKRVSMLAVTRR